MGGKYPKGWPKSILFVWELRFLCHSISYQKVYLINQIIRYISGNTSNDQSHASARPPAIYQRAGELDALPDPVRPYSALQIL